MKSNGYEREIEYFGINFKSLLHEQSRVRIMAVCFGHQIVGRAYGETAERNPLGWEVSVTPVTLSETGKRVFGCDSLVCLFTL